MSWNRWRHHFERNAERPLPAGSDPGPIDGARRRELARSLARFQLGEAGEGRIAREIWSARLAGIDDDYRVALGLFVKEEGRHARILADLVRRLDGTLLRATWTERLFVAGRRLLGARLKLLVLLAAEVIGIAFYGLLADALPRGLVRRALLELCGDEEHHLSFHVDFFRTQTRTLLSRALFRAGWWTVGSAAALAVLWDHRATLRPMEVPPRLALVRFAELLAEVDGRVLTPERDPSRGRGPAGASAHATPVATP